MYGYFHSARPAGTRDPENVLPRFARLTFRPATKSIVELEIDSTYGFDPSGPRWPVVVRGVVREWSANGPQSRHEFAPQWPEAVPAHRTTRSKANVYRHRTYEDRPGERRQVGPRWSAMVREPTQIRKKSPPPGDARPAPARPSCPQGQARRIGAIIPPQAAPHASVDGKNTRLAQLDGACAACRSIRRGIGWILDLMTSDRPRRSPSSPSPRANIRARTRPCHM